MKATKKIDTSKIKMKQYERSADAKKSDNRLANLKKIMGERDQK